MARGPPHSLPRWSGPFKGASSDGIKLGFERSERVIARIPGSGEPDEWVVRGNHHDAWVNGAEDPISGQISLLEEAPHSANC